MLGSLANHDELCCAIRSNSFPLPLLPAFLAHFLLSILLACTTIVEFEQSPIERTSTLINVILLPRFSLPILSHPIHRSTDRPTHRNPVSSTSPSTLILVQVNSSLSRYPLVLLRDSFPILFHPYTAVLFHPLRRPQHALNSTQPLQFKSGRLFFSDRRRYPCARFSPNPLPSSPILSPLVRFVIHAHHRQQADDPFP